MIDPNNLDNDDDRHIDSAGQFMGVCMQRLQGIDKIMNEKLFLKDTESPIDTIYERTGMQHE